MTGARYKEPCYCGSPDCRKCFPLTWDEPPPEFCDYCNYNNDCGAYGSPFKGCQKAIELEELAIE